MGVPRSLSWPAWPPRGSYLGVEEQRGRPQVFLLQDSHGVRHLPLLYPAGQQHRGLRTSPSCPGLHGTVPTCAPPVTRRGSPGAVSHLTVVRVS